MPTVQQILARKGTHIFTIHPDATVLDAGLMMNEHKIGALVVVEMGQVAGIVTERDMLRRLVAKRRDPAETTVRQIMTPEVVCCRPQTPLDEARGLFMRRRIRHLPVINDRGVLEGLVSIGDLNAWQLDGQELEIHYLHEYIHGRT